MRLPTTSVRGWLRLEGAAAFVAGLALYGWLGGPWLLVLPLLLVPDISMVGYLRGPRLGALTYNVVHNWALGLGVLGLGLVLNAMPVLILGAILVAHVGMDRAMGYGLKLSTSFQDTHLGRIGRDRVRLSRRAARGATSRPPDRGRPAPASDRPRP